MFKWFWFFSALAAYASFAWSVVGVFKVRDQDAKVEYRFLQLLTVLFWIGSLYEISRSDVDLGISVLGILNSLLGFALFWWARQTIRGAEPPLVFSNHRPQKLITSGPFKWVTHPFYVTYTICYLVNALLLGEYLLILCAVGLGCLYFLAAKREDRMIIQSELGEEYAVYKKAVKISLIR